MRKNRIAAVLSTAAAVLALSACDADKIDVTTPTNADALTSTMPGSLFKELGYTPVAYRFENGTDKVVGEIWVHCPDGVSKLECGENLHNEGTAEHPNVYTIRLKTNDTETVRILHLEGQHDDSMDDRSYFADIPKSHQGFTTDKGQVNAMLNIMHQVGAAIGKPDNGDGAKNFIFNIPGVPAEMHVHGYADSAPTPGDLK
jgi:hypothetical protein